MKTNHALLAGTAVLLSSLFMTGCSKIDHPEATTRSLFESLNLTDTGESQKASYDSQRRLTKITDKSLDSTGKAFVTTEYAFTYNTDGKIDTRIVTVAGQDAGKQIYLYTNGVFSGIDTYFPGDITPAYGRRYTLNAVGNVILTKGTKTDNDPEGDQFTIQWDYDANQNLIKATYKFGSDVVVLDEPGDYDTNPVAWYSAKDYALSPFDGASLSVNNPRKEKVSFLNDQIGKLEVSLDLVNTFTYDANGYPTGGTQTDAISKTKKAFTYTFLK